mmetsp:Transcript_56256/g.163099  ORF Transcript_56256/g.163099 Transcript_56256/m.163099 type:complete len:155 (+) Transcript_56256:85-549(+)|eukprot:CAMPEP_0176124940 /NCGR_PEP_ID=MMETSP0120_2-20121206/63012_1 /TAXON_ID=160619 /ORGANISM="Kryptoperidinium foliaceum, Strain CCMP 1326" /LENGTH=154 /DNA_ID=CAMNT_0017459757 /DNA_START=85 /DNA_END=549 /DNA_ORIENTATION=+
MQGVTEGEYKVRHLERDDFRRGYVEVLSQLTEVGNLTQERFDEILRLREQLSDFYKTLVIEHVPSQQVVGSGTLLIEVKFIHEGASCGHVEDIVVHEAHRGKGLAKQLMSALADEARAAKCYKVILDCNKSNVPFYEKCGYEERECTMRLNLSP